MNEAGTVMVSLLSSNIFSLRRIICTENKDTQLQNVMHSYTIDEGISISIHQNRQLPSTRRQGWILDKNCYELIHAFAFQITVKAPATKQLSSL